MKAEIFDLKLLFEIRKNYPLIEIEPKEYELVGMFLSIWNDSGSLKDDLIPYIDDRIKYGKDQGIDEDGKFHISAIEAHPLASGVIDSELTVITDWDDQNKNCKIKTETFKLVVLKWLAFLESQGK